MFANLIVNVCSVSEISSRYREASIMDNFEIDACN